MDRVTWVFVRALRSYFPTSQALFFQYGGYDRWYTILEPNMATLLQGESVEVGFICALCTDINEQKILHLEIMMQYVLMAAGLNLPSRLFLHVGVMPLDWSR